MPRKKLTGLYRQTESVINKERIIQDVTKTLINHVDTSIVVNPNQHLTERELEIVVIAKYGLTAVYHVQMINSKIPFNWPHALRLKFVCDLLDDHPPCASLSKEDVCHILRVCSQPGELPQSTEHLEFIGPPTGECLVCDNERPLSTNNPPVQVKFAASSGRLMTKKKVPELLL